MIKKILSIFISSMLFATGINTDVASLINKQDASDKNLLVTDKGVILKETGPLSEDKEPVFYQAPTFIDEEHPELGMEWETKNITRYEYITSDNIAYADGWFVLNSNLEIDEITFGETGKVTNIILCDGASLLLDSGGFFKKNRGIRTYGEVNFYGQNEGTGKLVSEPGDGDWESGLGSTKNSAPAVLNFYGGIIESYGYYEGSGIGYSVVNDHSDIITIYGGTIIAEGGSYGPGITTTYDKNGQGLTIYGGNITATGGKYNAGIGIYTSSMGRSANVYNIKIYGGNITATGGSFAAGIGGGGDSDVGYAARNIEIYGGTIVANSGVDAAAIGGGCGGEATNILIYGGDITAEAKVESSFIAGGGAAIGSGSGGTARDIKIYGGNIKATGNIGIGGYKVHEMYFYGGTIYAESKDDCAAIGGGAEANNIYFEGSEIEAISNVDGVGIGAREKSTNIYFNAGNIKAAGGFKAAGIGAGHNGKVNGIYITGGNITATGIMEGAGIGSAYQGSVMNIVISGGEVIATGGSDAAGIGGGKETSAALIEISGGKVTATGGSKGAGIGGGYAGDGVYITISGGEVIATGGIEAAGIGGSYKHKGEGITISGGKVIATGGEYAAGIGGGKEGNANAITITGGTVEVTGGVTQGAGIGGGDKGESDNITISGGYIKVLKVYNGSAAIGGGNGKACGNIKITGGIIEAKGGYWGPAIGTGSGCSTGTCNIEIRDAVIKAYAVDGGGYPAIGLGPWSSGTSCNVTISGTNMTIWNFDTQKVIENNGENVANLLGNSSLLITNGTIVPQGITVEAVKYSSSIKNQDKERLEAIMDKFSIEVTGELKLMASQVELVQSVLDCTDQELIDTFSNKDKHIDLSLVFEVEVYQVDFSNKKNPIIEYAIKPVATVKEYNGSKVTNEQSLVLKPSDFKNVNGKLKVTIPVPQDCKPTLIRHTSDDSVNVYNEFIIDDEICVYDEENQTVIIEIDHCSHLEVIFENTAKSNNSAILIIIIILLVGIVAGALIYILKRKQLKK